MAKVTQVDFPPRELVSCSKENQTPISTQPKDAEEENEEEDLAAQENEPQTEEEEAPPHDLTEEEDRDIYYSVNYSLFFINDSCITVRSVFKRSKFGCF